MYKITQNKKLQFIGLIIISALTLSITNLQALEETDSEYSVTSFQSKDINNGIADFLVTLSKNVIDADKLYTEIPSEAIQFTPKMKIISRWVEKNQIGIYLDNPLSPSVDYTFTFLPKFIPEIKHNLIGQNQFKYASAPFRVNSAQIKIQSAEETQIKAVGTISFNYVINLEALGENLSIISSKGNTIDYKFQEQSQITDTVLLELNSIVPLLESGFLQVKINKGFKSNQTGIGLGETIYAPINLEEIIPLNVNSSRFLQRDGYPYIQLRFSSQIHHDILKEHISISPSIPVQLVGSGRQYELRGDFEFGIQYTINIKHGMSSIDRTILRDTYIARLNVPNLNPRIRFIDDTHFIPLKGSLELKIATTNIDKFEFGIAKLHLSSLPELIHKGEIEIASIHNKEVTTELSLGQIQKENYAGIFKIIIYSNQGRVGYAERLVVITDLGIVAKVIENEMWVWVNSLDTLDPISNADVQVLNSKSMDILYSNKTDKKGFAKFHIDSDELKENPDFLITVNKDNDFSLLQLQGQKFSTKGFDIGGIPYLEDDYEAYLYTERGVYRPGETVNLVGIVRGENTNTPNNLKLKVTITNPRGDVVNEKQIETGSEGEFEIEFPIADDSFTGWYSAKILIDKKQIGSVSFQVEEFIPDRMKIDLNIEKDSYSAGDEVNFHVNSTNLYGTPAVGRSVHALYNLTTTQFIPPEEWNSFKFADNSRTFERKDIQLNDTVTDENGNVQYSFKLTKDSKPPSAINCDIHISVQDLGGRAVSTSDSVLIHPYTHYIGIRRLVQGTVKLNEKVSFEYIVLDTDGLVTSGHPVKMTVSSIDSHNWRRQETQSYTKIESRTLTSLDKPGTFDFTPVTFGVHLVELENEISNAKTSMQFYVSEWGGVPWSIENADKLDMTLDKPSYLPGEEAKLTIKPPFQGKVLLTIERDKVLSYQTITLKNTTKTIAIPVKETYSPNVYLSAILIRSTTTLKKDYPARAYAILPLKINADRNHLHVAIHAPDQVRPNSDMNIQVKVNGKKKEQSYMVTIAAIDEGIIQLTGFNTPDPHSFFYQKRSLDTQSFEFYTAITRDKQFPIRPIQSLSDMLGLDSINLAYNQDVIAHADVALDTIRSPMVLEMSPSSQAAERMLSRRRRVNSDSVLRVKPTSLWSGLMATDKDGNGNIRINIPQFNGTLRLMAVAFAGKDFGSATSQIQVRDPVVITPTFPRFLSSGDRIRVPVNVYNGNTNAADFKVKLQVSGPVKLLSGKDNIRQTVVIEEGSLEKQLRVEPDSEAQVYFDVIAHDVVGISDFNLSIIGGGEEIMSVPVSIPIRSPAPYITKTGHGIVGVNEPAEFILPSNLRADTSEFIVTLSPLPSLRFANGLRYLIQYPYGCLEQTTSRVFPLLYLTDLARIVEPTLAEEGKIKEYIEVGIKKIEKMLGNNLMFSYWQRGSYVHNWSSIYAAHFLVEARIAGYQLSDYTYNRMIEGLRRQVRQELIPTYNENRQPDKYRLPQVVYACYVLSKARQAEKQVMFHLRNNRIKELNDYSIFQLAGSFAHSGNKQIALSLLPDKVDIEKREYRDTGWNFDSSIRSYAIILDILMEIKDDHPLIPHLVESLTDSASERQRWGTTQENAYAFLALGKYLNKLPQQKFTGEIVRDNDHVVRFDTMGKQLENSDWDGSQFKINIEGNGTCYYYWEAFGIGRDSYIEEYGNGIVVNRRYLTQDQSRVKKVFQQGELLIAEISVKSLSKDLHNVVVVDMLPAGVEIENPRLKTRSNNSILHQQSFRPNNIDIRDDRLILFGSFPKDKEQKFYYSLRAVTEGSFTLPPISAEAMYDPSKSAVAGTGTIQVVR